MRSCLLTLICWTGACLTAAGQPRSEQSLVGPWEFRRDETKPIAWKPVTVPSSMQSHEGDNWHGIGWYRKQLRPLTVPAGQRLLLHITAAATHAEVYWNGAKVGEHLGGWTAFRVDVTDQVRAAPATATHEVTIKLDERVGHNTQGFLPVIQPHFGGLWQSVKLITVPANYIDDLIATVEAKDLPTWSPQQPRLQDVIIRNDAGDRVTIRTAQRQMAIHGKRLMLNGQPLHVRGVLNWGYYPPNLPPLPSEQAWRDDLRHIKARGFNLMKCCLWVPPRRLLEIADEEGVLIWIEYPTWHPQFTAKQLPELTREFEEFFAHVRHHPSVILHSLTCETGPSADIAVIRALTARCKAMIPGAIVEDDSSWIEWNRVTDFYDDHPYGNNHTWRATLRRLDNYQALGVKPLLLGEAIAADTWTPTDLLPQLADKARPYWLPHHQPANAEWLQRMKELGHDIDQQRLTRDSKQYAMLMRKYQIETFRREAPSGGYVVSVMRDFPLAAMGLLDYSGRDKWPIEDWRWHGETVMTLKPRTAANGKDQRDCQRCFAPGEAIAEVVPAGPLPPGAALSVAVSTDDRIPVLASRPTSGFIDAPTPHANQPKRMHVYAQLTHDGKRIAGNSWPIWIMPSPRTMPDDVMVIRRLDEKLLQQLEAGARMLLLPDNGPGSPPLTEHWFLRGGPVVMPHPAIAQLPRGFLVETQHFDLAGPVIANPAYLAEVDPILLLWDTHDIRTVKTHAVSFSTRVGAGRLLISTLRHDGDDNPAGRWMLGEFAHYLHSGPAPSRELSAATIAGIRNTLNEVKLELGGDRIWKFRPDPDNQGLTNNWHQTKVPADGWTDIRIHRHWESQGFPTLDGWAWYRLQVTVPASFTRRECYLKFTGVDDYYEVYVDGVKAGSGGDIASKSTAFDEIKCHNVTSLLKPGETVTIAVRVYDWYGAGGIFRPVTLTTSPSEAKDAFVR